VLNWIIDFSLRNRFLVIVATVAAAIVGAVSMRSVNIDAFPDITPVQVQINTVAPALGPEEVERQITFPVEQVLSGLPRLDSVRSDSKFGLSQVVVTFQDGTDIYFARQVINERLGTVELPAGIDRPRMGPVATGLGEVFHYLVIETTRNGDENSKSAGLAPFSGSVHAMEARLAHDWVIRPNMRTVRGTAEINSWGGFEHQYQVRIDPDGLVRHGVTFDQVVKAIEQNNRNVGGGYIRQNTQMLPVHGLGRTEDVDQIKNMVITAQEGVPIRIGDVAQVEVGHEVRRGAVTADGKGEVVLGLGFMLMGENSHVVTRDLKHKLDDIKTTLPPEVKVEPVYDRTELIDHVIRTVRDNLFEGGLLVIVVLFAFLGNLRAAAIVALAIPLSLLFAFSGMLRFGIAASLLSLGAIDFGMIVDSSVVMVENCVRHIAHGDLQKKTKLEMVRDAAVEVRKPTLFGELIIMVVYLPILTLEGIEGKLFRPMALTVIFALTGSMILSMTLMPVLASLLLPRRISEREPLLMRLAQRISAPVLRLCMNHKILVLGFAVCVLVFAFGMVFPSLGTDFVPKLSEGAFVVNITRQPGIDLDETVHMNTRMERTILEEFPDEVQHIWSRVGVAEVATDPMGVEETDMFITLKPRQHWREDIETQEELGERIERTLRQFPGQKLEVSQPIEERTLEMISGTRAHVSVKIFGDDYEVLKDTAEKIERVLGSIEGNSGVKTEQLAKQPVLQIKIKQDEIARYGVPAKAVLDVVEAISGKPVGEVVEGQLRHPLVVRLPEQYRTSPEKIYGLLLSTPSGERIPLTRLASVEIVEQPTVIKRDWSQRRIAVTCNIRDRDLGGFVAEAQKKVADEVKLPPGRYRIEWGGTFEQLQRARTRLLIAAAVTLVLIVSLLYWTYRNVLDVLRVCTGIPFAWVGGIFALWLRGMPFSISAAIGFIALSGVAVLDDMILVSYIRQLRARGVPVDEAVQTAAITRLRPVLMTTLVASLGFLPMAFSTGMGAEVQRPLATVVIGGVIGAMVMSLVVLRVLYVAFEYPRRLLELIVRHIRAAHAA
jgi:cobalt-zinc-cadmium resistance protein CzcA